MGRQMGAFHVCFCYLFRKEFSLPNPGWPGPHYGDQPDFELVGIPLPLSPPCWDYRHLPLELALNCDIISQTINSGQQEGRTILFIFINQP